MFHPSFQRTTPKTALNPQAISGSSAVNGNAIDRLNAQAMNIILALGATTGTPTGTQLAVKIQHGDASNLSDAADFATVASLGSTSANFTAGDVFGYGINLEGAKRYVRVVVTPTFTGGTAPTVLSTVAAELTDRQANAATPSVIQP